LRNAIEANPEVDSYHLKLLEILRDDERHAEAIDVFDEIQETCSLAAIEQAKALMKDPSGVLDATEESLAGDQDTQVDSSTDSDSDHNDSLASTSGTGNAAPSSDHVDALFDQLQERQRQQQEQPAAGDVALELEAESFEDTEFDLEDIDDLLNRDNSEADLQASSVALLDELDLSELLDSEQVAVASDSDDNDVSTADEPYAAPNEDAPAAKLDLARAYIDMEDFESARVVLEDVLQVGDEAQRREAQALLTTL
jgi:pilus assembly protein FimV